MHFKEAVHYYCPKTEEEAEDKRVTLEYIAQFPDTILYRKNCFAHFTSSGLLLNPQMDKILMIYHNIYDTWAWTGGHADGEADLYQVACKEAEEETGVNHFLEFSKDILSLDILTVNGHWKNKKYVSSHIHINATYVLIAKEQESIRPKLDENQGVQWIAVDEIEKYSDEKHIIPIYQKVIKRALQLKRN